MKNPLIIDGYWLQNEINDLEKIKHISIKGMERLSVLQEVLNNSVDAKPILESCFDGGKDIGSGSTQTNKPLNKMDFFKNLKIK